MITSFQCTTLGKNENSKNFHGNPGYHLQLNTAQDPDGPILGSSVNTQNLDVPCVSKIVPHGVFPSRKFWEWFSHPTSFSPFPHPLLPQRRDREEKGHLAMLGGSGLQLELVDGMILEDSASPSDSRTHRNSKETVCATGPPPLCLTLLREAAASVQ